MVYYGKLSKGCERCRRLKVKCDQHKPGCRRCERTKSVCPGYRDLVNFGFRHDSARTAQRIQREAERGQLEPIQCRSMVETPRGLVGSHMDASQPPFHTQSLQQPLGALAANFYFTNLAIDGPPSSAATHDILQSTYLHDADSAASHAIEAVGLAALSNLRRDQYLFQGARARYARSLIATNQMIGDPGRMSSDATAMAVLLLGQFESMYLDNKESAKDGYRRWAAHVAGASALLRLRGQEQFEREVGVSLFFAIRLQVLTDCICREVPVPEDLLEAASSMRRSSIKRVRLSATSLEAVWIRFINLNASLGSDSARAGDKGTTSIIAEATRYDRELDAWRAGVIRECEYSVVRLAPSAQNLEDEFPAEEPFDRDRYVYKYQWTIAIWNKWRIMKILVHDLILQHCPPHMRSREVVENCENIIRKFSAEICLSLPSSRKSQSDGFASELWRAVRLTISQDKLSMIWPLFLISQQSSNSCIVRTWAVEQLRRIDDTLGVRQAGTLAKAAFQTLSNLKSTPIMESLEKA